MPRSCADELQLIDEVFQEYGLAEPVSFGAGLARKKWRQKDVQKMVVGWLQRTDAEQELKRKDQGWPCACAKGANGHFS
jgi:predicted component of type VI protein secretion system